MASRPRTRQATKELPLIQLWFMVVDHNFTRTLKAASRVEMPFDGFVLDFQREIKAMGWNELERVHDVDLKVWKLRTPRSGRDVKSKEYLANFKHQAEISEEEVEEVEGKGKGKAKEKEKKEKVAWQLDTGDKISSHFKEPSTDSMVRILVQLPAPTEGTSYCAVSTRCQLTQLRMSSKHKLQLFFILMFLFNVWLWVSDKT